MFKHTLLMALVALTSGSAQTMPWGKPIPEIDLFASRIQFATPNFVIAEGMDKASTVKVIGSNAKSRVIEQHSEFFLNIGNLPHDSWMAAFPPKFATDAACGGKCVMEPTEFSFPFAPGAKLYVVFAGHDAKSLKIAMMYVQLRPAVPEEGYRVGDDDVEAFLGTPDRKFLVYRLGKTGTVQAATSPPIRGGK